MKNTLPWLIAGIAIALLVVGGYMNAQRLERASASAGASANATSAPLGPSGNSDALNRCRELITDCNQALQELRDCSKFLHVITLGLWCDSEATKAVATCTAASEVCKVAQ